MHINCLHSFFVIQLPLLGLSEAHVGLGVTDAEFDIVAGHLGTTLKEFKVHQKEYDELIGKIGGVRSYVVEARIKKYAENLFSADGDQAAKHFWRKL